jgi:polyhydroxyalkanoate synthase
MPATMHSFYLRNMYQHNRLVKPGGITLKGVPVDLSTITTPTYLLAARDDHIVPWASSYAATRVYRGPVTFTLAGSGHIAGVINPPAAKKYSYWTNDTLPDHAHDWLSGATEHEGSWWPHWRKWLNLYAGDEIKPRPIRHSLGPAPGSYVRVRAV